MCCVTVKTTYWRPWWSLTGEYQPLSSSSSSFSIFLFFGFIYGQNFGGGAYGACLFMLGLVESPTPLKSGYVSTSISHYITWKKKYSFTKYEGLIT
jgi:hypothetical protein